MTTNKRKVNASQTPLIGRMAYTLPTWRTCGIWLRCERGESYAVVELIGACALHPWVTLATDTEPHKITIRLTHVPTGLAIRDFNLGSNARIVAEALSTVPGLNTRNAGTARRLVGQVIGA